MRRKVLILLAIVYLAAAGRYFRHTGRPPPPLGRTFKTENDPASIDAGSVDLANAPDFQFTWGDGSGWHGYNVLKVAADGRASYTFMADGRVKQVWKYASFTVDPQTVADLRATLVGVDYFRLKRTYYDPHVADGTQRFVKVIASGKRKGVYGNNYFPPAIEEIRSFAETRIIEKHSADVAAAQEVEIDWRNMESESFER